LKEQRTLVFAIHAKEMTNVVTLITQCEAALAVAAMLVATPPAMAGEYEAERYAGFARCLNANLAVAPMDNPIRGCNAQYNAFVAQCSADNWGMPYPEALCRNLAAQLMLQLIQEKLRERLHH
jgi:hypothetical protein